MKTLIINADDLGYTEGINAGIARCFQEGLVRSATLMATGEAFENAVQTAKKNRGLGLGVHLVLTEMKPLAGESDIPGLIDENGCLPPTPIDLLGRLLSGRLARESLWKELNLQVSRVLDAGLVPTHLDSHKHVHLLPQVLEVVLEICARYSIRWIRYPFESLGLRKMLSRVDPEHRGVLVKQYAESLPTGSLRGWFKRKVARAGVRTPDHFFGLVLTGIWNEAAAAYVMETLPPGVSEWMVHPGYCDGVLVSRSTRLKEQREREKNIVCASFLKKIAERKGVRLSPFGG